MYGIGIEDSIEARNRPVRGVGIEQQRWPDIVQSGLVEPGPDACMMYRQVTRLPTQMRQLTGKINGVLTGTTGNFQYPLSGGKLLPQHR